MIIDLKSAQKVPFKLDGRIMYSSEKIQMVHLNLKPGEKIELHSNPFDVVFYVLEGEGIVYVDENNFNIEKNQALPIKSGQMRGCYNTSKHDFSILVTKIY